VVQCWLPGEKIDGICLEHVKKRGRGSFRYQIGTFTRPATQVRLTQLRAHHLATSCSLCRLSNHPILDNSPRWRLLTDHAPFSTSTSMVSLRAGLSLSSTPTRRQRHVRSTAADKASEAPRRDADRSHVVSASSVRQSTTACHTPTRLSIV
jgi:hypothetical protein